MEWRVDELGVNMRLYHLLTAAYITLAGCQSPAFKGDFNVFHGSARTAELKAKVDVHAGLIDKDRAGVFVRERATESNYKRLSEISNFALTDAFYEINGFAAFAGTRSTARVDTDNTRNSSFTQGHINLRSGLQYTGKFGGFRTFAQASAFTEHDLFTETNTTVGYRQPIRGQVSLDGEVENVLRLREEHFDQNVT